MCPESLLFKFTNFLSKRPDLLSDNIISMLTKTELACLLSIGAARVKNQDECAEDKFKQAFEEIFENRETDERGVLAHSKEENKTKGSILALRPGSKVRIRKDITSFYFGKGNVDYEDIGTVMAVLEDGVVHVDFQKGDTKGWRGLLDEVEEV